jgi:hypothetical protein
MVNVFKRLFSSSIANDIRMDLLPDDEYVPARLEAICRHCPRKIRSESRIPDDTYQKQLDDCRREFFGVLLESFTGKPGDAETNRLYSYLRSCERCLLEERVPTVTSPSV